MNAPAPECTCEKCERIIVAVLRGETTINRHRYLSTGEMITVALATGNDQAIKRGHPTFRNAWGYIDEVHRAVVLRWVGRSLA